jgi:acetyl esterase/lipase
MKKTQISLWFIVALISIPLWAHGKVGSVMKDGSSEGLIIFPDVEGLPKTYIIVNECDPLRDEGVNFYRLLREADVDAQCRQVMGSVHGTEIFLGCIEISDETAMSIANFCKR